MSDTWIESKRPQFVRDMFRDFCLSHQWLERAFREWEATGELSFVALKEILGMGMNKGLMWRLKDTAHHVLAPGQFGSAAEFLDWAVGFIFHECIKLKEGAYLDFKYRPKLDTMLVSPPPGVDPEMLEQLRDMPTQNRESIERIIIRIRSVAGKCRKMMPQFLKNHSKNELLARFIFAQDELVREVFGREYDELVETIYENEPALMYVLASQSLRKGGWMKDAVNAMAKAHKLNPDHEKVLQEKGIVDNWSKRFTV